MLYCYAVLHTTAVVNKQRTHVMYSNPSYSPSLGKKKKSNPPQEGQECKIHMHCKIGLKCIPLKAKVLAYSKKRLYPEKVYPVKIGVVYPINMAAAFVFIHRCAVLMYITVIAPP